MPTLTCLSAADETTQRPPGEKATDSTAAEWASSATAPLSQIFTVRSSDAEATSRPSWESTTSLIPLS